MTDFFDDLERQLVTATPQRGARIRRARARRIGAVAASVAVLLAGGVGIAAAVGAGGGSDGPHGGPAGTGTATTAVTVPAASTTPSAGPEPFSYEVAILNGTTIPGLARAVGNRLRDAQIRVGQTTNAPRQDVTETTIYYRSKDCLPAANQVASVLRLGDARGRFTLKPITKAQTALVGEGPVVVVVAGSDQNHPVGP